MGCAGCDGCAGCYGGLGGAGVGVGAGIGYDGVGGGLGGGVITPGTGTGTGGTTTPDTGDSEGVGKPKDGGKKPGTTMVPSKAQLVVDLPADARLFIDEQKMKTPSGKRTFNTPRLQPGQTYYYILRAEVEREGKTVAKTQRVLIRAGETARASFSDLDSPESVAQASAR
jgi:uncharacterized protein (TIGR03000 family)